VDLVRDPAGHEITVVALGLPFSLPFSLRFNSDSIVSRIPWPVVSASMLESTVDVCLK